MSFMHFLLFHSTRAPQDILSAKLPPARHRPSARLARSARHLKNVPVRHYFSPNTSAVLNSVSSRLSKLPLSSPSLKRTASNTDPAPKLKIAKMGDVNMPDDLLNHIVSTKYIDYPALGWTAELVKFNQTEDIVDHIVKNPDTTLAAVILASDFLVRTVRHVVDIAVAIPKVELSSENRVPLGMPWGHIVMGCFRSRGLQ
ncbi:hypothetical protein R3P38DRAFT_2768564 [Favolaschia claudopus]|uniref:Uncharacterized protein n=1 Tax=Favolaschia claudopus TaxID=2862362 RepID=A0AAW0CR36_9AGAR